MSDRGAVNPCARREDWLEPLVDGEFEGDELASYRSHLDACETCRAEYEFALALQRELHSLPEYDTPPQVLARILDTANRKPWHRRVLDRLQLGLPTPAWAALATALVLVVLATSVQRTSPPSTPELDPQVAQAAEEARIALAWVGGLTRRTAQEIRTDVLVGRVVDPTRRALGSPPNRSRPAVRPDNNETMNDSPQGERSG